MQISDTIEDLWQGPHRSNISSTSENERLTQILPGEIVKIEDSQGAWSYINAMEQPGPNGAPYRGWMRTEHLGDCDFNGEAMGIVTALHTEALEERGGKVSLGIGTKLPIQSENVLYWVLKTPKSGLLQVKKEDFTPTEDILALSEEQRRVRIVRSASMFLGSRYLWGGRSSPALQIKGVPTGVDCSGLVNLAYRCVGVSVPRDAHDQWVFSQRVQAADLRTGDLIFSARKERPDRISHVLVYLEEDRMIEAVQNPGIVRTISGEQKFGTSLREIDNGSLQDDFHVWFGSIR